MPCVSDRSGGLRAFVRLLVLALCAGLGPSSFAAIAHAQAGAPPPADAPPFPYRLRGRTLTMPANGALPIESLDGSRPLIHVRGPEGIEVPGALNPVGYSDVAVIFAWVPQEPPAPGTYAISLASPTEPTLVAFEQVRVIAPFSNGLPSIRIDVSASLVVLPDERECCHAIDGSPPSDACFVTRRASYVSVEPGFSSPAPSAQLDQYLFRLRVPSSANASTAKEFVPFAEVRAAEFYEPESEYCLQVESVNLATRRVELYPGPAACARGVDAFVGTLDVDVPADRLSFERCPLPPEGRRDTWCSFNAGLCETEDPFACAVHEHVCSGEPAPSMLRGLGASSALGPAEGTRSSAPAERARACSTAHRPSARAPLAVLASLLMAAAALARRRHRPQ